MCVLWAVLCFGLEERRVTQLSSKVEQVLWNIFDDLYQCLQVNAGLTVYIGYVCVFWTVMMGSMLVHYILHTINNIGIQHIWPSVKSNCDKHRETVDSVNKTRWFHGLYTAYSNTTLKYRSRIYESSFNRVSIYYYHSTFDIETYWFECKIDISVINIFECNSLQYSFKILYCWPEDEHIGSKTCCHNNVCNVH